MFEVNKKIKLVTETVKLRKNLFFPVFLLLKKTPLKFIKLISKRLIKYSVFFSHIFFFWFLEKIELFFESISLYTNKTRIEKLSGILFKVVVFK